MNNKDTINPYRPGAGYLPPYLAGREKEVNDFVSTLKQDVILKNPIITGLRGIGKTVLLTHLQPLAEKEGWVWVGTELSSSVFVSEETVCRRLITDLAFFTSTLSANVQGRTPIGLGEQKTQSTNVRPLDHAGLTSFFESQPGLYLDKLKATFELAWPLVERSSKKGIIFAYDEAQIVEDRDGENQYPLSTMLALFQSLQRKGMRYMLLLSGLPTLFPRLVDSRTYSERMFTVQTLGRLSKAACTEAIQKPLERERLPLRFSPASVDQIIKLSGGYPYFVQFICRECFDHFKIQAEVNPGSTPHVPVDNIIAKLDSDFFAGRWSSTTDRQREMLLAVASIDSDGEEFSVAQIEEASKRVGEKRDIEPFNKADISQMIPKFMEKGLIFKVRYGRYSFALPMFKSFIVRQFAEE